MKIPIAVLVVAGGMALGASGQSGGTVTVKQDPVDRVMDSVAQMDRDRKALEIERQKQEDLFHEKTLAQIFIENRIYKRIEKCETLEQVMKET